MMKSKNAERMKRRGIARRELKIYHINEADRVFRTTKARKVKLNNYLRAMEPERVAIIDCYV